MQSHQMVQPQEDLLVKIMNSLSDSHAETVFVETSASPYMEERSAENAVKVENFSLELGEQLRDVQLRVNDIRTQITEKIGSHTNISGFLRGEVDDYFEDLDEKVNRFYAKIAEEKAYWEAKAKKFGEMKGKQTDGIKNVIQEAQLKIA